MDLRIFPFVPPSLSILVDWMGKYDMTNRANWRGFLSDEG